MTFGNSATYWWKRFPSPNLVPPCCANPVTTTTSAGTLPKNNPPSVDVHLCHRHQVRGTKIPSNDGNEDQGSAKTATGQDTAVKEAGMWEMKQHKVAFGATPESNVEMFFKPSKSLDKYYTALSNAKQWCHQCAAKGEPCIIYMAKGGKRFQACDGCAGRWVRCNALHELLEIVNSGGQVIHAASSWGNLTNLKINNTEANIKATMTANDKGKGWASEPEEEENEDHWTYEPIYQSTLAIQVKLVSTTLHWDFIKSLMNDLFLERCRWSINDQGEKGINGKGKPIVTQVN